MRDVKKQFSHLLVLFFQLQIKLTNRKSVLRNNDKQKSTISDKLTAETLHTTMYDMEPSDELVKMEVTVANLEHVLAKLNAISDEFFGSVGENGQRGSKTSNITFNDEGGNYTTMFNNATVLTDHPNKSNRTCIFFVVLGMVIVAGFALVFYFGHKRASQ